MLQLYVLKYLRLRYICVITSTPILILALLNYKDAYSDSCFQNSKSQFTVANNFHHFWERSVNCNVHGPINVVEPLSCIIDTPPFQRLHYLKQIGLCYMVFPTAKHTRFEHSLGQIFSLNKLIYQFLSTYHLAFQFAKRLMDLYPNFVDKRDVLCVSIAGLIHDLGKFCRFKQIFYVYFFKLNFNKIRSWTVFSLLRRTVFENRVSEQQLAGT